MDSVLIVKIVSLIIYPLGLVVSLLLLGLLLRIMGRVNLSSVSWGMALIILLLASNPILSRKLAYSLEQQYPQYALSKIPQADAIIVLGGGLRLPIPPAKHTQITAGTDRYWYATRLYKQGKANKIILSGGNVFSQQGFAGEAHYAAKLLNEWGVPLADIIIEQNSRTTAQNAERTKVFLEKQAINSALLVTSALHMPRSYGLFSNLQIKVFPASTDTLIQQRQHPVALDWLPSANALSLTTVAMHEYYGMWANRWLF